MNQIKIGIFISQRRKIKGWTQKQLAEQLGITSKAISKWETGKSMPDVSLFTELCSLLEITLNELLLGECISEEKLAEKSEQVLMNVIRNWIGVGEELVTDTCEEAACILKLKEVQKIYETEHTMTKAVDKISFDICQGSFVGIMGASGSGKTSLLNMIAAIDRPTKGSIEINGRDITQLPEKELAKFRRDHLGFVFQEYNLLESLSIYENIALALTIKEMPKGNIRKTVSDLADKLDISAVLNNYPYEVSGGQRQRCACARAIAMNPDLILADEPTGALDSRSARQLLDTFGMMRREFGATILMVTHDAVSASYCDKILFLQDGAIRAVLDQEQQTKHMFFTNILDTMAKIEGGSGYVS